MDRIEAALTTIKSLLLGDETILQSSYQLRLHALKHRREVVVATNMRLIIFRRRLIGGYRMHDIRWQDLQDAAIDENLLQDLFGAELRLRLYNGLLIRINGLEVVSARALYVYCQQQEQEWRERNRIRGMEERGLGFTRFDTLFDPATPGTSKRSTQSSSSVSYSGDSDSTTTPIFNAEVTGDIGALQGLSELLNPQTAFASADKLAKAMADAKQQFESGKLSKAEYQSLKMKILSDL